MRQQLTEAIRMIRQPEFQDLTQVVALTVISECKELRQEVFDELRKDRGVETVLALYIRYSQVVNDYSNVDNWFAYGLYKALLPLTCATFDGSIQGQIAREAVDNIVALGFGKEKLANALDISADHSDEKLYEDPELATRLCQGAYDYLQTLGVKSIVVVIDGPDDALLGSYEGVRGTMVMLKAWKEEESRRRLPWLSVFAFVSAAVGREIADCPSIWKRITYIEDSND